jgi:hypothetical protein
MGSMSADSQLPEVNAGSGSSVGVCVFPSREGGVPISVRFAYDIVEADHHQRRMLFCFVLPDRD